MSEMTTISKAKLANLEDRVKKLAADKAHLQLIVRLMNRISAVSGLDNTVEALLQAIGDVIGGINLCLYYVIDDNIYYSDAFGNKKRLDSVDDGFVKEVFETRKPIEHEHAVSDARMLMTPEFTNAYTWVVPLLVGEELIAVIKIDSLHVAMRELSKQLPTFFSHAAFVLKNEILGQTRLKKEYDKLEQEVALRKKAEEELRRANEVLEERVAERTSELQSALDAERQAEEVVRKSAEEIQDLYDHAPCGYHSLDKDGVFVRINDTELSWLGYTREEVIGKMKFQELLTSQSLERFQQHFPGFIERGWVNDLDFEMVRKDGTALPVLLSATAIKTANGEFVMSRSVVHDITERKRAEEKSAALAAIVESSDDAIIGKTLEGVITSWNKGAEKIYGYTEREVLGSSISLLIPPGLEDEIPRILVRMKNGEHMEHYETRRKRKDGQVIHVSLSISPIRNAQGQTTGASTIARDITERKQFEQMLAEAEAKYRCLVEGSLVGVYLIQQGRFVYVNACMAEAFGYRPEELIGLPIEMTVAPADRDLVTERIRKRLSGQLLSMHYTFHGLRKDGEIIDVEVIGTRTIYNGQPAVVGSSLDITERKRSEEALHRLNRELRAISNCNQTLMRAEDEQTLLNAICRIICDEAGYRMAWVGYRENDEAKTIRPVVWAGVEEGYLAAAKLTWADTERGQGPTGTAIRSGKSTCIQDFATNTHAAPWRESALQRGYQSSIALALRDENANIFGALTIYSTETNAFSRDEIRLLEELAGDLAFGITTLRGRIERKRAETLLRKEAERSNLLLELYAKSPQLTDKELYDFALSHAVQLTSSEIGFLHLVSDDQKTVILTAWNREALKNCTVVTETHYAIEKAGNWADCVRFGKPVVYNDYAASPHQKGIPQGHAPIRRFMSVPVTDGDKVRIIFGVGNKTQDYDDLDVTHMQLVANELQKIIQQRCADDAMKKAKEVAESANQAKDQFLAMLSHELRTPLTPVLATVSALQAQEDIAADLRTDMDLIRRNVEMEAKLVDDLLDVTRISRGTIELHPEVVDVHLLLRTALEICLPDIEAKHMEVTLSLQADPHQIRADPTRLRQVFWNLLKNAVEFTPEKGRISLRTSNTNDRLKIEIEDTGVGIRPELLPKIFHAFERGNQTAFRRFGGLGLGLSIAKTVVEMHQGTITAFSEGEGKGATFTVELPSIVPALAPPPLSSPLLVNGERIRKILLVDDHPDTLRTMSKLLCKWGYAVVTADCVRAALELAAKESFDLLISDLGLPDGSGRDIMEEVKRLYTLRGIALSGYGTEEDIRRSLDAGFEKHLTKPVSFQDLRDAIRAIVSDHKV